MIKKIVGASSGKVMYVMFKSQMQGDSTVIDTVVSTKRTLLCGQF